MQLGLAHGCETWAYPTNTLLATVAFLLLLDTNLLSQAGITHYIASFTHYFIFSSSIWDGIFLQGRSLVECCRKSLAQNSVWPRSNVVQIDLKTGIHDILHATVREN